MVNTFSVRPIQSRNFERQKIEIKTSSMFADKIDRNDRSFTRLDCSNTTVSSFCVLCLYVFYSPETLSDMEMQYIDDVVVEFLCDVGRLQ